MHSNFQVLAFLNSQNQQKQVCHKTYMELRYHGIHISYKSSRNIRFLYHCIFPLARG